MEQNRGKIKGTTNGTARPESLFLVIDTENRLKQYETRPTTEDVFSDFVGERAEPYIDRGTMPDDWLLHYRLPDKGMIPEQNGGANSAYLVRLLNHFKNNGIKQDAAIGLHDAVFCRDMGISIGEYQEKQRSIRSSSHYDGFLEMVEKGKYGEWNCVPKEDEYGLYSAWVKRRQPVTAKTTRAARQNESSTLPTTHRQDVAAKPKEPSSKQDNPGQPLRKRGPRF